MSDTRKITIEILSTNSNTNDESGKNGGQENHENEVSKIVDKTYYPMKQTNDTSAAGKMTVLNYAFQQAAKLLKQSIEVSLDRGYTLTEDYINQNNYQNIKTAQSKIVGLSSSLGKGIRVGASGGPVGMVLGAVVGAASWYAEQKIQQKQDLSSYYQDLNASNFNTQFNRVRAGLVNDGRGTDN